MYAEQNTWLNIWKTPQFDTLTINFISRKIMEDINNKILIVMNFVISNTSIHI